jgi:hypothetical protein
MIVSRDGPIEDFAGLMVDLAYNFEAKTGATNMTLSLNS